MEKNGSQLHQLLAVTTDLENQWKQIFAETLSVLKNKTHLFESKMKTLTFKDDSRQQDAPCFEENTEMVTTVKEKLAYAVDFFTKHIDAELQKEEANQRACADIVYKGNTIAQKVPATALLNLTKHLVKLRELLQAAPTLAQGLKWELDAIVGYDIFSTESKTAKTEKVFRSQVTAPATKEHKAQVATWTEDTVVGYYTTIRRSSALTPAEKARLLANVEEMITAVKQARAKANRVETQSLHIGKSIWEAISK